MLAPISRLVNDCLQSQVLAEDTVYGVLDLYCLKVQGDDSEMMHIAGTDLFAATEIYEVIECTRKLMRLPISGIFDFHCGSDFLGWISRFDDLFPLWNFPLSLQFMRLSNAYEVRNRVH